MWTTNLVSCGLPRSQDICTIFHIASGALRDFPSRPLPVDYFQTKSAISPLAPRRAYRSNEHARAPLHWVCVLRDPRSPRSSMVCPRRRKPRHPIGSAPFLSKNAFHLGLVAIASKGAVSTTIRTRVFAPESLAPSATALAIAVFVPVDE